MTKLTLKDFIDNFVEKNSIIRLWYKNKDGGHELVVNGTDSVSMEHQTSTSKGIYKSFINHKIIGVTDILVTGSYQEAINIVIERIPIQKLRDQKLDKLLNN